MKPSLGPMACGALLLTCTGLKAQDPGPMYEPIEIDNDCVIAAAAYYRVQPELIVGIRWQEGGRVGNTTVNRNGSYDIGPMQINSAHLSMFSAYGVSEQKLMYSECTNIFAGAYILHEEMANNPSDIWRAIGNYNSSTPLYHNRYRAQMVWRMRTLYQRYAPYVQWLRSAVEAKLSQRPIDPSMTAAAQQQARADISSNQAAEDTSKEMTTVRHDVAGGTAQ